MQTGQRRSHSVLGTEATITLVLGIVVAACGVAPPSASVAVGSTSPSQSPQTTSPASAPAGSPTKPTLPDFNHVYVIVMENKEGSSIIGNPAAPVINDLVRHFGLATNYTGVGHPSEPNYLAILSGSTQGVTDDGIYNLQAPSVLDGIDASGRTWRVAEQNDRAGCFTGASATGGEDGPGTYARKHNPAISFTSISGNPVRCARITDLHALDPAAARFTWIEPNLCNSMHDCSIAAGDAWLGGFLPKLMASSAYEEGGVIFLTWDEGGSNLGGGGRVATLVISPLARVGFTSAVAHDHYSLLRTIQDAWGLPCLAHSCQANDLREFFR